MVFTELGGRGGGDLGVWGNVDAGLRYFLISIFESRY